MILYIYVYVHICICTHFLILNYKHHKNKILLAPRPSPSPSRLTAAPPRLNSSSGPECGCGDHRPPRPQLISHRQFLVY